MTGSNKTPFFTIITPSFNQGRYIGKTIQSVLSQGFNDLEYFVFDGGSTDETITVLQSYGNAIKWVSEQDRGQSHAINKGLTAGRGKVIGWVNSDDIYYPGALQAVHDIFEEYPEIEILYGMADHIDENDAIIEPYYNEEWDYERLKEICFICQPAVFFRRSIVEKFGMLDEDLQFCMDYEYWLRIGKEIPLYYFKKKIAGSRLHASTKTLRSPVAVHEEIFGMLKKKIGHIPDIWILGHAHSVARMAGLKREDPAENFRFIKKLITVSIYDSLRLKHYISFSLLKTVSIWFLLALKSGLKYGADCLGKDWF